MRKHNWNQIIEEIGRSKNILLTTHINPDGDGLGSEIAFYRILKKMGKNPTILNPSSLPDEYGFLQSNMEFAKYSPEIHKSILSETDLLMVFDIGNPSRLSRFGEDISKFKIKSICIDHHPSENSFFDLEVIDTTMPSTASLVYDLILEISHDMMDKNIADALYTGLMTDTGSFRFENADSSAFGMAIDMLKYGVKPSELYIKVYENRKPEQMLLLGLVLQNTSFSCNGKLAYFQITHEMIEQSGAHAKDVDGFTDFVRSTKGVEVAVMFLEMKPNRTRMNFRSRGRVSINQIAKKYGGGGHPFAAGAVLDEPMERIVNRVLDDLKALLDDLNE